MCPIDNRESCTLLFSCQSWKKNCIVDCGSRVCYEFIYERQLAKRSLSKCFFLQQQSVSIILSLERWIVLTEATTSSGITCIQSRIHESIHAPCTTQGCFSEECAIKKHLNFENYTVKSAFTRFFSRSQTFSDMKKTRLRIFSELIQIKFGNR